MNSAGQAPNVTAREVGRFECFLRIFKPGESHPVGKGEGNTEVGSIEPGIRYRTLQLQQTDGRTGLLFCLRILQDFEILLHILHLSDCEIAVHHQRFNILLKFLSGRDA